MCQRLALGIAALCGVRRVRAYPGLVHERDAVGEIAADDVGGAFTAEELDQAVRQAAALGTIATHARIDA